MDSGIRSLLARVSDLAAAYLDSLGERRVFPEVTGDELRQRLGGPLPERSTDARSVLEALAADAEAGLVGTGSGRYFGFVTGGKVPAALAADWLVSAWDQNAFSFVSSPAAAVIEEIAGTWLKSALGLPTDSSVAFVTGCQMAHVTCLAAARQHVLEKGMGWDVAQKGLAGAPPIRVVAGLHRHVTVDRALRLLGIGTAAIEEVATDDQGRIEAAPLRDALRGRSGPTLVVAQAGEVNTGSFDPLRAITDAAREAGAWVHVDGAFGIWAAVSRSHSHLVDGLELADSWAFDAHKWLNVPYDCGVAVVAHPDPHRRAMVGEAAYLLPDDAERDPIDWTPDASRRARGVVVYAALRSLGFEGIAGIVERCCAHARRLAEAIGTLPGAAILNDVVLNQVLVAFDDDERTLRVLKYVQRSGEAWMGETEWRGRTAIRISVSSQATTDADVDRTVAAFAAAVAGA